MITLSQLPDWLKRWTLLSEDKRHHLDEVREKVETFRASFKTMTYEELCYILAMEFTKRKRPRRWMIEQLIGRLNTVRNQTHMESIVHLRTYVFRHA